ncbi:MAG: DUF86 domain-containing protein [Candidatus Brocadiia bacterium]
MSRDDWQARVEDILESIANLQSFVQGMAYEEFATDTKTVRAAAYEIMIIGEAAAHVPEEARVRFPEVPWDTMRGIRNIVVHEYFRVDLHILWQTITKNLPPLVPVLESILHELRPDAEGPA